MLTNFFKRPNCLLNRRNRYQLLATVLINLISISHGFGIGWLSPTLRKLQSTDSPLNFPLSVSEISWVGSALGLGNLLGNVFSAVLINRIGCKLCLLLIAVPYMSLWFLVYFAKSVDYLIVGRFMAGITGGGIYVIHPIFLSEISDANIRGTLASTVMLSSNTGTLLGYILGTHVDYHTIPFIALILPLSFIILVSLFVRDSPVHLIRKGKFTEAEKSFRYYRRMYTTSKEENIEFNSMKLALTNEDNKPDNVVLKDLITRPAIRGYFMAFVIVVANQFCGIFTMINYMSDIFAKSGSTIDPNTSSIITGCVQILGAYVSTLLCDVFGRKSLMLVSSAGAALCLTAFGFFSYFAGIYDLSEWSWVPVTIMSMHIFLGNIGLISCMFVLLVEMFPLKIRAKATSAALVVCSLLVFLMLNIFPLCMESWGLPATLWSLAGVTSMCFLCFLLFLKETKGKSMLED